MEQQTQKPKDKEFFTIYKEKDGEKKFLHIIEKGQSKKKVVEDLRARGLTIKGVFSQKDINKILKHEFTDVNVSDKTLEYVLENLSYWEENKTPKE